MGAGGETARDLKGASKKADLNDVGLLSSSDRTSPDDHWIRRVSAAAALVVAVITSVVSVIVVASTLNSRDDTLKSQANAAAQGLERGVEQAALKLEAIDGFFRGSRAVSQDEFDAFADSIDLAQDPDSVAVAMKVEGGDLEEFTRRFRRVHPDASLTEVGEGGGRVPLTSGRSVYYIVMYHRPSPGGSDLVGFDLASQQTRLQAIAKATRTDETVVSGFVQLVGENRGPDGFLIVSPVHDAAASRVGVAVAAATSSTLISAWVPETVTSDADVVVSGAGNELQVQGTWVTPVEKEVALLPDRTWSVSVSPIAPHWWVVGLIAALTMLTIGLGVAAGLLTRVLLIRRSLSHQLDLIEALAKERQARVDVLSDFELITANSTDLIVRQGPDLTYRWVSPSMRTVLGYEPEELVGMKPWSAIHRDDADQLEAARRELVDGADTSDTEHRARRVDGQWVWLHTVFRAIRDDEGALVEIQTSSRDVTEQVVQRAELLRSRNEIEKASAEKARFLATVSHEIRTPLTAVSGMAELMVDSNLDEDQREQLDTIRMAATSVVTLVNDLLDLSKAEVGRLRIEADPFDPTSTIRDVVRVYRSQAAAKGVDLVAEIGEVPTAVVGDAHRIRQILVNLVGNALKFTNEGSVTVSADTVEPAGDDSVTVRMAVSDSGIGIPDDRLEAIFEEFEQVDASTARRFGGTGLGLGISRYLVHLMGGVIGVESEEGSGSTFWFEVPLPLADTDAIGVRHCVVAGRPIARTGTVAMLRSDGWLVEESDTLPVVTERAIPVVFVGAVDELDRDTDFRGVVLVDSAPRRGNADRVRRLGGAAYIGAPVSGEELRGLLDRVEAGADFATRHDVASAVTSLRVLAADDAPSNRLIVERTLTRRGHRVVSVSGGVAAIDAFRTGEFDVVVLDGQMPDMTGMEVTRIIRSSDAEAGRHTPIVALTGRVSEEERAESLAAGADMWVAKPFDAARLHEVVEQAGGRVSAGVDGPRSPRVLDLDVFHSQVAELPEFAVELVEAVREEWRELCPALEPSAVPVDLEGARSAAHRLKGVLGLVGATHASEVAARLEESAGAGDAQRAREDAAELAEAYRCAEEALAHAVVDLVGVGSTR